MISVITCWVSQSRLGAMSDSLAATIGCEYELIAIDNRDGGHSLASAYNEGARRAQYPFLYFVHEDVAFYTDGWGEIIAKKLSESGVGYVGFAGSTAKPKELSAWYFNAQYRRMNLVESTPTEKREWKQNPDAEEFAEVVTLDGMALMTSRATYDLVPFDEVTFSGFHFYDLDVTVAAHSGGYRNFVCNTVEVEHLSAGSYNRVWYDWAKVFCAKWADRLPLSVENLSERTVKKNERLALRSMTYLLIKKHIITRYEARQRVRKVLQNSPLSPKSYLLWIILQKNLRKLPKKI